MKILINTLALIATLTIAGNLSAQTIYNITSDITVSGAKMPEQCSNCIINISKGVTLTINREIYLQNTTFNGGTVLANKSITFWSDGQFNATDVIVKNNSAIVSSGALTIKNAEFTFNGNSTGTFWAPVTMNASKMKFMDNSSVEVTSGFNLVNNSSLTAGDGTPTSKAFIKFNGGTLNEYDNSSVSVANNNNYYFNWSNYNSISNNKSYQTTNNTINCGTSGKNGCSAPVVYGPATLNFAGVASSALLPVKLSAFAVKLSGTQVELSWTTDMELNAGHYEIERSFDGLNWTKIATVASHGTTSVVSKYVYTDILKLNATVSYRLKMVDQDESFVYSPVKAVKASSGVELNIFPNPATNYVVISSKDNNNKNVQLINFNGQVVKQTSGTGNISLSVSEFTSGNYIVKVTNVHGEAGSFKLVIKK
jgi:hypothetical protein